MTGLKRNEDGRLFWSGGRHYSAPADDEAILTWWAGELRPGCNAEVQHNWSSHPCGKSAKHDPDAHGRPTKCGVHSAKAVARRKAKVEEKQAEQMRKWKRADTMRKINSEAPKIIRAIADGHNDPRALAADWVRRLDEIE
jgi:hypothetical protein